MKWFRLLSAFLPMVMLTSCAQGGSVSMDNERTLDSGKGAGGWRELSPKELSAMLDAKDFVMVNVHTPYEGELPHDRRLHSFRPGGVQTVGAAGSRRQVGRLLPYRAYVEVALDTL